MVRATYPRWGIGRRVWVLAGVFSACFLLTAKQPQPTTLPLNEQGKVVIAGRSMPYLIRRLPVNSFPELPARIQDALNRRGCTIPQTYEAHGPENVVHGSLERAGSSDWAVLCSTQGTVSLLVFFGERTEGAQPAVLASTTETERLQVQAHSATGVLGFDWGIDRATPEQIHEAQNGMAYPPARVDHDAVAEAMIDHPTTYHFYAKGAWSRLQMPD
jgi:hypothetical protein